MARYSRIARRKEASPQKIIWLRHSSLMEGTKRSIQAFKFGERGALSVDFSGDSSTRTKAESRVKKGASAERSAARSRPFREQAA